MLNTFVGFNSYLLLNSVVVISYIAMHIILRLPFVAKKTLQMQRLNCARYSFCAVTVVFFIMPVIMKFFPCVQNSNFNLGPILKNRSFALLRNHDVITQPLPQISAPATFNSIGFILIVFLLLGVGYFLIRYVKNKML